MHITTMKLSDWMNDRGVSDEELGRLVGKDRTTILRIRRGSHKPSPELMADIAKHTEGAVLPNDYFDDLPVAA